MVEFKSYSYDSTWYSYDSAWYSYTSRNTLKSRDIDIVVKLEEGGKDLDLHLYSFFFFSYCFSCKIQSQKCNLENHFSLLKKQRTTPKTLPKIIPKEKAAREAEEEETSEVEEAETTPAKDQI